MGWTSTAVTDGPISDREVDPETRAAVEDVLDAAAAWRAGTLPLGAAIKIGGGYLRMVATSVTPKADPRWHDLQAMIDTLVSMQGYETTRQGVYSRREVGDNTRGWQHADWEVA